MVIVCHYPQQRVPVEAVLVVTIDVGLEVTLGVVEVAPGVVVMALILGMSVVAMVVIVAGAVKIIISVDSEELMAGLTSSAVQQLSLYGVVQFSGCIFRYSGSDGKSMWWQLQRSVCYGSNSFLILLELYSYSFRG